MTMDPSDPSLARFTGWFQQRPTSLVFWELFVTDSRVVWCFVGESFKSLLLRADTGERGRTEVDRVTPERALTLNERNFAVSLDSVRTLQLRESSCLRRAVLTVAWREDDTTTTVELYGTQSRESHADVVRTLREEPALSHVDISVETTRLL